MSKVSLGLVSLLRKCRGVACPLSSSCLYTTSGTGNTCFIWIFNPFPLFKLERSLSKIVDKESSSYYSNLFSYWKTAYDRLYGQPEDFVPVTKRKFTRNEEIMKMQVLVEQLFNATDDADALNCAVLLKNQLSLFPSCREAVLKIVGKDGRTLVDFLSDKIQNASLRDTVMHCLELCGYIRPIKSHGIRVLSIDGGGTRGVMALECLNAIEARMGGKKMHELFDLIVGVSTGAVIATLIGAKKMSIAEALQTYSEVSKKLFNYGIFGRISHTKKNSQLFEQILKEEIGSDFSLLDSFNGPKLAIISCVVNNKPLMPFLFRNYEHPPTHSSHYRGSTKYKFWEAILASSAAPTYFKGVILDNLVHQDGGVLMNNPTAIALHEARQLWPRNHLQCIISVGNGRVMSKVDPEPEPYSWTSSVDAIIDSATETETTHYCISDLLPTNIYFRLNPYTSQVYPLDTNKPDLIEKMRRDAKLYIRRNREKIDAAVAQLETKPSFNQRIYVSRFLQIERRFSWNNVKNCMKNKLPNSLFKMV
uniref:PNPLA domain-containing protein n=1 Tax=Meloidogyne incognita TaxID=6306 RepID=A0A914KIP2_MELIC